MNFNLPEVLEPYRQGIAQTIKPYIKISTTPNNTQFWESKFGGLPYLPQGINYPKNAKGDYLKLLAQLNFSEIPSLDKFPHQGILQFYIDAEDELYGLNFDNLMNQDGFRVLYFPEVTQITDQLVTDFQFLEISEFSSSPILGEFALNFTLNYSPIPESNSNFEQYFPRSDDEGLLDIYYDWFNEYFRLEDNDHKIGGYPNFTQEDPRFNPQYKDYILLLQIDSDYNNGWGSEHEICWGDAGIGNFFIHPAKLQALDFSEVLYNWDCG